MDTEWVRSGGVPIKESLLGAMGSPGLWCLCGSYLSPVREGLSPGQPSGPCLVPRSSLGKLGGLYSTFWAEVRCNEGLPATPGP